MEVKAYIKNVKTSPKKLRFMIANIKKLSPDSALDYLFYTNKKSAKVFYKALKSAISNIKKVKDINENSIKFKQISIEEGQKLKRYRSGGRGGVKQFKRKYAHIKIILEGLEKIDKQIKSESLSKSKDDNVKEKKLINKK
jgi:large subunit ribosomal protein L22